MAAMEKKVERRKSGVGMETRKQVVDAEIGHQDSKERQDEI